MPRSEICGCDEVDEGVGLEEEVVEEEGALAPGPVLLLLPAAELAVVGGGRVPDVEAISVVGVQA